MPHTGVGIIYVPMGRRCIRHYLCPDKLFSGCWYVSVLFSSARLKQCINVKNKMNKAEVKYKTSNRKAGARPNQQDKKCGKFGAEVQTLTLFHT